jgi:ankyrin repeat protein
MSSRTPLTHAAAKGHDSIVRILLGQANTDLRRHDDYGKNALAYARRYGHDPTAQILLRAGCEDKSPHTLAASSVRPSKIQRTDCDVDDGYSKTKVAAEISSGPTTLDATVDMHSGVFHEMNNQALFRKFEDARTDLLQGFLETSSSSLDPRNKEGRS